EIYSDFIPHQNFGTVVHADTGERTISEGIREANNFEAGGDLTINFINEMSVSTEIKYYTDTELTGSYSGNFLKITYATSPLKLWTRFAGTLSGSGGTLYNFDQKYVGSQNSLSSEVEGRFMHNILTTLQGDFTKTFDPHKENDGRHFKLSSNTTWMFT